MLLDGDRRIEQHLPPGVDGTRALRLLTHAAERGEHRPRSARAELVRPGEERRERISDAALESERAVVRRGDVLDGRREEVRRPEVVDRPSAHDERDVAAARLLVGEHAHRRDARPSGDKEEVLRRAADEEGRAERTEEVERVARAACRDPLAAGAERLHDELDLARRSVDAIEGVRPPQQRVEPLTRPDVDELPGMRALGDARRRDLDDGPELRDLERREHLPLLEDHGRPLNTEGTPCS